MAEKNVNIKITADSKKAEEGLNKVTGKINAFSKSVKQNPIAKFNGSVTGLMKSFAGVTGAITLAVASIKKLTEGMKEANEAYLVQARAEKQLEQAAKNNPYLLKDNVSNLKKFASEMQNIGNVGDEELLPLMTQLASAGRTEAEIQDIITAALNASATGAVSLESAVTALNASYSGNVGQLRKLLPNLKTLTSEELKSGKAISEVNKAFSGQYEAAKDTSKQLENLKGDFKEIVGSFSKSSVDSWNNMWMNFYNKGIETLSNLQTDIENKNRKKYIKSWRKSISDGLSSGVKSEDFAANLTDQQLEDNMAWADFLLKNYKDVTDAEMDLYAALVSERSAREVNLKVEKKRQDQLLKSAATEKEINDYKAKSQKDLDAQLSRIDTEYEANKKLGNTIDENAYHQERYNAIFKNYVDLIANSNGQVTAQNQASKDRITLMNKEKSLIKEENEILSKAQQKDVNDFVKKFGSEASTTVIDSMQAQIDKMKELLEVIGEGNEGYKELADAITNAEEALKNAKWNATIKGVESVMSTISSYVDKVAQIANSITSLLTTNLESQTSLEETKLETMYENGLMSYEAYAIRKLQIEKENAQKSYEIETWAWGVQLLQAQASTALSMVQALADTSIQNPAARIAMMGLMGALGAAQTAAIIAAKPQPPSFATGGIVGGNSYSGDNVRANVNSGEMILNAQQQMEVWKMANGKGGTNGGVSLDVEINNNASDVATATVGYSEGKLIATINKIVNSEMQRGSYTDSMLEANSKVNGVKYL